MEGGTGGRLPQLCCVQAARGRDGKGKRKHRMSGKEKQRSSKTGGLTADDGKSLP